MSEDGETSSIGFTTAGTAFEYLEASNEVPFISSVTQPPFRVSFHDMSRELGVLTLIDGQLHFEGDADESARILFEQCDAYFERHVQAEVERRLANEKTAIQDALNSIDSIVAKREATPTDASNYQFGRGVIYGLIKAKAILDTLRLAQTEGGDNAEV